MHLRRLASDEELIATFFATLKLDPS